MNVSNLYQKLEAHQRISGPKPVFSPQNVESARKAADKGVKCDPIAVPHPNTRSNYFDKLFNMGPVDP